MTASSWDKALKQLSNKPGKLKKYMKHSAPKERSCGVSKYKCAICGRPGAHINKYGIHLCRQCFREVAKEIGFETYS